MGGVINLIKKLFSGILSLIGLGGKSSGGGYYMEAEPLPATEAPKKAAAPAATEAKKEAAKAEPVQVKAEAEKPATAELNGSVNGSKPPVPANTLNMPQPTVTVSATAPTMTTPRRRPGANMGAFLEMAKTVKTPNN